MTMDNNVSATGPLELPEEILAQIFGFLDTKTLKNLKLVHSKFKYTIDVWCKLNLCLNHAILDASRPPIAKYREISANKKFDRIIFRNVRFIANYQKFLWNICARTKKITIIADAYLIESGLKFQHIREILSSCPNLEELELRLHVITICNAEDEAFLCGVLQSIRKFKFKGEIKFENCNRPISRIFQWLSRGNVTHLLWSKMGTKIFASSVSFHMSEEDKNDLTQEIQNFLQKRKNHLKTFWIDGFWGLANNTAATGQILSSLAECQQLEQSFIKSQDWSTVLSPTKKMIGLRYLKLELTQDEFDEKFVESLVENLEHLKGLWVCCSGDRFRRFFDTESVKRMRKNENRIS